MEILQLAFHCLFVGWVGKVGLKGLDGLDESLDGVKVIDAGFGILGHVERAELGLEEERVWGSEQL